MKGKIEIPIDILSKVKKCVLEIAKVPGAAENNITEETSLIEDLSYDSIMMIELVIEVEDCFDIEINDEDLLFDDFDTFYDFCLLVYRQICEQRI